MILVPAWRMACLAIVPLATVLLQGCATAPPAEHAAPASLPADIPAPPPADATPPAPPPAETPPVAQALRHVTPVETDLWDRMREGFAMPDLDGDLVRHWERWYASRPDYVARMTERGGRYLFHVVEEVHARGLPMELALLPFIESAFNPQAVSSASAAGMWQFIPSTGRAYDLKQNHFRDERRDVLASTRAALDYLQGLHRMFGDWHLALAAYNWGEGRVQRALTRGKLEGGPGVYERLRMPAETRHYVPKLQAVKNLVSRPQDYGLVLPPLPNAPRFVAVPITRDIDVDVAAELAGLTPEVFRQFNPQHDKPVILAAGSPELLLPHDNANRFLQALPERHAPLASWTAWVAPRTLKPAEAAKQHGIAEDELRRVNRIPAGMLVREGSTLIVPRKPDRHDELVPAQLADHGKLVLAPDSPMKRAVVQARRGGESVAALAKRYRLTPTLVAQLNDVMPDARFKSGARVVVMVPVKKTSAGSGKSSKTSRSPAKRPVKDVPSKRPAR